MTESRSTNKESVPVIDLFAGPGGLAEGFSSYKSARPFRVELSIEKDPLAHATLLLRTFRRQFPGGAPSAYYDVLRGSLSIPELYDRYPTQAAVADREAWHATLGETPHSEVHERIRSVLKSKTHWVLVGGPPCQAYSVAGRARNRGVKGYRPEDDVRQYLYVEYLRVIADHWPSVFVMENVKGLLSASVNNEQLFRNVLRDLEAPADALRLENRSIRRKRHYRYRVVALAPQSLIGSCGVSDFIVAAEKHGIPQSRHRVILIGIRDDLGISQVSPLHHEEEVPCHAVLEGIPRVRSGLSQTEDHAEAWLDTFKGVDTSSWLKAISRSGEHDLATAIVDTSTAMSAPRRGRGASFIPGDFSPSYRPDWFSDGKLEGISQHETRQHIATDLHRYLFVSCFAQVKGRSPRLGDFPKGLLPDHNNVSSALGWGNFNDRFRVQLKHKPATTITSHIAKDGHYYIHYDPSQCRSLTLREAARLQTFPDNYLFCGPRTEGYSQVGNAVPPLLAARIAERVWAVLKQSGAIG
jgi:DNA (cytosine-5)-methyltransferase 1